MIKSVLAGIVERHGGVRVVVTAESNVPFHVGEGERVYVVPDFFIEGEIPTGQYPGLIDKAVQYVRSCEG